MKHIELEHFKFTYGDFDIDDKYTLQQIRRFIGLNDDEYAIDKTDDEILDELRKHGVKIHNYKSHTQSYSPNNIHVYDKARKELLD